MLNLDFHPTGRHFLQIPGPSPVPDRILRAMSLPTIDHRGPEFGVLGLKVMGDMQKIFQTKHPVMIYPASGTGAWEAALVNTLCAGDHVLMYETGHFAFLWNKLAARLGIKTEVLGLPGAEGWRHGVNADTIEQRLRCFFNNCLICCFYRCSGKQLGSQYNQGCSGGKEQKRFLHPLVRIQFLFLEQIIG